MAEVLESTPHAYLVAGGGGGMRSTIILRLLAQELTDRQIPYTAIEGISGYGDEQEVHYPTLQMEDMAAHIDSLPKDKALFVVSHCIGTVAALGAIERFADTRQAALVAVAPPLPSPRHTIMTPQSQKKRSQNDTRMRVIDLPIDALDYSTMDESYAHIDPQYFADIHAADDLEVRLRQRVEAGGAAVFAPEHDWNAESPKRVRAWHDEWRSTQTYSPDWTGRTLARAAIVAHAAHGLYISPRSGHEVTQEQDLAFQRANVSAVIDTGVEILKRVPIPLSQAA